MVEAFLDDPSDSGWKTFKAAYAGLLAVRFKENREPFEQLASLASDQNVFLGCNCPTNKNPDVRHCHTFLALDFMKHQFPTLDVVYPEPVC